MVGLGLFMLALAWYGAWRTWRRGGRYPPWFLKAAMLMGPSGFAAVITGWITAEVGRQPWTVYGLLRTADSVSPVTAEAVGTSLIVFVFAYSVVFSAGAYFILQLAAKGPEGPEGPERAKPPLPGWMTRTAGPGEGGS
jgi:cytochrome d ubiquinol oxidase subunit I